MNEKEILFAKTLFKLVKGKPYVAGTATKYSGDKKLMYYLDKWIKKGFWECGVSVRSGWFTEEGIEYFKKLKHE